MVEIFFKGRVGLAWWVGGTGPDSKRSGNLDRRYRSTDR